METLLTLLFFNILPEPITLVGVDNAQPGFQCQLTITEIGYSGPEQRLDQYYAQVQTNYAHAGEASPVFHVRFSRYSQDGKFLLFEGRTNNGDILRIQVPKNHLSVENAIEYRLRWLHDDHYHQSTCTSLKRI
jgi:hypothetical protein